MVEHASTETGLDRLFHALSDQTRRAILARLTVEPALPVGDLAAPFDMSLNAVSKHLKVLESAGLLRRERDGRVHRCSANFEPLGEVEKVVRFYQQFWEARFDDMDEYLKQKDGPARKK